MIHLIGAFFYKGAALSLFLCSLPIHIQFYLVLLVDAGDSSCFMFEAMLGKVGRLALDSLRGKAPPRTCSAINSSLPKEATEAEMLVVTED